MHPLVRRYGSIEALAGLPDDEIRAVRLAEMSALLTGRDAAQAALADYRAFAAAIDE